MRAVGWQLHGESAEIARSVARAWRGPGRERDLTVLALKATLAAVVAWSLAAWLLRNTLALMAPWVAVLLVQTTVYRSVARAAQQTVAILVGTVLATAGGMLLGDPVPAMALVLPLALLIGNWQRFGDQGIAGATSALFTLAGGEWSVEIATDRVLAALLGAAVGVTVNALVLPPVYLRSAHESICGVVAECREILTTIADGVAGDWGLDDAVGWQGRVRRLPGRLRAVRSAIEWGEESARLNPDRRRQNRLTRLKPSYEETLHTLEHVADHLQGLTRTLVEAADREADSPMPGAEVIRRYAAFLREAAGALGAYGATVTGDDPQEARQDLERRLRQVEAAHGDLQKRLLERAASATPDTAALEQVGSLLAEARRLTQRLRPDVNP
ncbi:aromatic acid exporter family protein [Streptomyces stramineus]|uniref:Aromatic acid exporter family protein n=1 Tax=Streptomyces stramineus TaxID=173861 RepID=A0ABN1AI09_9ACTN